MSTYGILGLVQGNLDDVTDGDVLGLVEGCVTGKTDGAALVMAKRWDS